MNKVAVGAVTVVCAVFLNAFGQNVLTPKAGSSAVSKTAGEQSALGEKAVVKMLGLEMKYDQLFSPKDHIGVIMSMPGDGSGQFSYTRQWNKSQTAVIGYSWGPKKLSPEQSKLNVAKFLKACGEPDSQSPTLLAYGRVTLSFDKEGKLTDVAIRFDK